MSSKKRTNHDPEIHRRLLLAAPAILLGVALPGSAKALTLTPRQSEGPFYPRVIPEDHDADLTLVDGQPAPGEVIEIVGQLRSLAGEPIGKGEIEIWHCDANGTYAHVGKKTLPNFQGYGVVRTDATGAYRFRTTRPGVYPGRTRHVHVKAHRPGGPSLTTQMYFPGEPDNAQDFLLRRASDPAVLIAHEEPGPPPRYVFDIVLA